MSRRSPFVIKLTDAERDELRAIVRRRTAQQRMVLPTTTGVPLSRWSCKELACELVTRAVMAAISVATVWRILDRDVIRPWSHRSWIFPRDPDFAGKAAVVLDLYARIQTS